MKNLLRRILDSDTAGAVSLALAATVAFGILFFAATAGPVHAQGEGVGTLPRIAISSVGANAMDAASAPAPSEHFEYVYRSGGADVHVRADIETSELGPHFAHRCKVLVDAFKAEFPPDP